jgi:hypothetical protein
LLTPAAGARAPFTWDFQLDARYHRYDETSHTSELRNVVLAGAGTRGAIGWPGFGFRAGLDARFGAGLEGGFAYDAGLLPLGIAAPLSSPIRLGLITGIATSGVTNRIPFTLAFPAELAVEADLGWSLLVAAWVRPSWVLTDAREHGSELVPWAEELEAGALVRIGKGGEQHRIRWGNGYFLGVSYREQLGTSALGVLFGHSLDAFPAAAQPIRYARAGFESR